MTIRIARSTSRTDCTRFIALALLALVVAVSACTTTTGKVRVERRYAVHGFEFDVQRDSREVELLDYQYGSSDTHGVRACPRRQLKCKVVPQSGGTFGEMEIGDRLYVKWRIRSTGEVIEDSAYFGDRLPSDMWGQSIYFVIAQNALSVFLIGPTDANPNPCPPRERLRELGKSRLAADRIFSIYCYRPILTLYSSSSANTTQRGRLWE